MKIPEKARRRIIWKRLRQGVQLVSLGVFLFLLVRTSWPASDVLPLSLYVRMSPHLAVLAALASRSAAVIWQFFVAAIVVAVVTVLVGRFFCGWICPLGTSQDIFDRLFLRRPRRDAHHHGRLRKIKYYVLIVGVVAAAFGSQIGGWVDPMSIASRSYGLLAFPAFDFAAKTALGGALRSPTTRPFAEPPYRFLKSQRLIREVSDPGQDDQERSPYLVYAQMTFIAVVFAFIVMAQVYQKRFWCRNICPLGALLGLMSRLRLVRPHVSDKCIDCGRCERACGPYAIEKKNEHRISLHQECTMCLACLTVCPVEAVSLRGKVQPRSEVMHDTVVPARRGVIAAVLGGIALVPLLRLNVARAQQMSRVVRPPGALPEDEFLERCIRCGLCMKVCPTQGLHPCLLESGLEGLWTPRLLPSIGYCQYDCAVEDDPNNLCGKVCPSGAIQLLDRTRKHNWKMGTAFVQRSHCITWVRNIDCGVCEEHCPTKAIVQIEEEVTDLARLGQASASAEARSAEQLERRRVKRIYVLQDKCIGCGRCENVCPVIGKKGVELYRLQKNTSK